MSMAYLIKSLLLSTCVLSAYVFSPGFANRVVSTDGESVGVSALATSEEAINRSGRFLCADSCVINKAGAPIADAKVVSFDVTSNPYCSQDHGPVAAWAVKFAPIQISSRGPETPDGFTTRRSFTVFLDSSKGDLLEVRSDTIDNGQAFVTEFSPKEWKDLLPILHDENHLLLDSKASHTALVDALRQELSLLPAQYFVAYLVTVADSGRVHTSHQWEIYGYGTPPFKDGMNICRSVVDDSIGRAKSVQFFGR